MPGMNEARDYAAHRWSAGWLLGGLCLGSLLVGCAPVSTAAGPPPPSRVGYERLQQAYGTWQFLDRARDATARLRSWREVDPEGGSTWLYAEPNRIHYQAVGAHVLVVDTIGLRVQPDHQRGDRDAGRGGGADRALQPAGRRPPLVQPRPGPGGARLAGARRRPTASRGSGYADLPAAGAPDRSGAGRVRRAARRGAALLLAAVGG